MRRNRDGIKIFADIAEERAYYTKKAKFLAEQPDDPNHPMINGSYDIGNFNTDRPQTAAKPKSQPQPQETLSDQEFKDLKEQVEKLSKAVEVLVKCRKNG